MELQYYETIRETGYGLRGPRAGGRTGAGTRSAGGRYLRGRLAVHGGRDPNLSAEGTR